MKNNLIKRLLSFVLSFAIVFGMIPGTAFKTFASSSDTVYISVSYDGVYINGKDGKAMANVPVKISDLEQIDLDSYGLGDYKYDANGDGSYETTVLHLYVYTHTTILGKDWSEVTASGSAGSIFFSSGLFGFGDCNLNYYLNGAYPLQSEGWGATADICALKSGDFVDVAGFTSWAFFSDSNAGFKYFTDSQSSISHSFTAKQNEAFSVNLVKTSQDMMSGSGTVNNPHSGAVVYYSQSAFDSAANSVTTDGNGSATITFNAPGTWYIWSYGEKGIDVDTENYVNAPAYATVTVEQGTQPDAVAVESVSLNAETAELEVDGTVTLTATVLPENATDKTVVWTSDDETVATVADGVVTALAEGTATVTATAGGKSASCTVTVTKTQSAVIYTGSDWPYSRYYVATLTLEGAEVDYISGTDVYLNSSTAKDAQFTLTVTAGGSSSGNLA